MIVQRRLNRLQNSRSFDGHDPLKSARAVEPPGILETVSESLRRECGSRYRPSDITWLFRRNSPYLCCKCYLLCSLRIKRLMNSRTLQLWNPTTVSESLLATSYKLWIFYMLSEARLAIFAMSHISLQQYQLKTISLTTTRCIVPERPSATLSLKIELHRSY